MKKLTKSLLVLMLMLGTMLEMKAADVYLLTAQTINGSVGKYEVPTISLLRTLFPQEEAVSLLYGLQQMSHRVTIS